RVGAQSGDVIGAAHRDVLGGKLFEELTDLVGVAGAVLGQDVAQREDRPQGVANHFVEVTGLLARVGRLAGARGVLGHEAILPRRPRWPVAGSRGGAGTRTPSAETRDRRVLRRPARPSARGSGPVGAHRGPPGPTLRAPASASSAAVRAAA